MMGIYVEKAVRDGRGIWIVRDTQTKQVLAFGDSIVNAVQNYEIIMENKKMAEELGADLENLSF